jgi:CheY-like chemotaxis protein
VSQNRLQSILLASSQTTVVVFPDSNQFHTMEPARILIVDDEPQILRLFERILTAAGYVVRAVASGADAMAVIRDDRVDLLVLDLSMPEPDGFEMLKMLRSLRPDLKVLVISGFLEGAMLRAAALFGATATLNKADVPLLLLETVGNLLGR